MSNQAGSRSREASRKGVWALLLALALAACLFVLAGCSNEMGQAQKLERQGKVSEAVAIYLRVLKSDPNNREALDDAGVYLSQLGRFDEALVCQERLAGLNPSDAQIRVELGFNYLNHQRRTGDAVKVLGEAVKLDPSAQHLCFLAQAQTVAGDTQLAEQNLRQAIKSDPGYAFSYELLAGLLKNEGRSQEADTVIEQAASRGVKLAQSTGDGS